MFVAAGSECRPDIATLRGHDLTIAADMRGAVWGGCGLRGEIG